MATREISKIPPCPKLSPKVIDLLNQLCFRKNDIEIPPVDCLFIFGTAVSFDELAESLKELLQKNIAERIVITGGMEKYQDSRSHEKPEAEMIYHSIAKYIPKEKEVILEKKSQNTLENILFALPALKDPVKSFCFVTKSFHAGRAYLTLRTFFKDQPVFQHSFNPFYKSIGKTVCIEDWHLYPEFSARIWGEYLRIKKYGERGDIPLEEVNSLLQSIQKETNSGN